MIDDLPQSSFYFIVRLPSGLEFWVLDIGQPAPTNTVRREMGLSDSQYGSDDYNG